MQGFLAFPKMYYLSVYNQKKKKKKLSVLASLLFHDSDAPDFLRKSISDAGKTFYLREVGVMHYYIIAKKAEKSILINFRPQGLVLVLTLT